MFKPILIPLTIILLSLSGSVGAQSLDDSLAERAPTGDEEVKYIVGARSAGEATSGGSLAERAPTTERAPTGGGFFSLFNRSNTSDGPLPVEEVFQLDARVMAPGVIELNWTVHEDYYLYRDHLKFSVPEGVQLVDSWRQAGLAKDDSLYGQVDVWHDQAVAAVLIGSADEVIENSTLEVTYQGCWDGGICYPPVTETVPLSGLPLAAGLSWPEGMPPVQGVSVESSAVSVSEHDRFTQLLSGRSLPLILAAFFVAGLALSLTPCVFPMIPILSSIIAGQQERVTTRRALGLSSVYVLAMAVTYTLAGVLAGLFGANIQASFQNPWIISVFAGMFVLLALSMFGFYELQLPSSLQNRLNQASRSQKGGQVTGVAVMGFLSALIVGPCMAAPLAGALIYIGQTGDPLLGGTALFAMSMGMGVPLLLIGTSAGRFMPRAGSWMKAIKAGFGVLLLLLAVWMLDRIVPLQVTMALTAIILIITAVYLSALDKLADTASGWLRLWKGIGLVLLVYGVALLLGLFAGGRSLVYPLQGMSLAAGPAGAAVSAQGSTTMQFNQTVTSLAALEPLLAEAKAAQQPVMLDFYADWCVTCSEMEFITFADAGVQTGLSEFVKIKIDVTRNDGDSRALNQRFQVYGPPALVFFDQQGKERRELAVHGVIKPQPLLQHITPLR
ncbi:protein-disulfide reductase DsbD [Nitrincola iocasae]|uniref:protein-disulfide reductase DsbD n=1 Tax=Nitrincola iocasae TaxID=2614693 RepID=UPI001782489F|nr:protein-disulfide reductase DsbD [Nitrincola iocasae]